MAKSLGIIELGVQYTMDTEDSFLIKILSKVKLSTEKTKAELIEVSVADLGFINGAVYCEICAKGISLGMSLCRQEVGPQFYSQFKMKLSRRCNFAMMPVIDSDGDPIIFTMAPFFDDNDHESELNWDICYPDDFFLGNDLFIFVLPQDQKFTALAWEP